MTIVVDRGIARARSGRRWPVPTRRRPSTNASLAIKARVPVDVLAETIHAFPSTSRIFNGLFADALRELDRPGSVVQT